MGASKDMFLELREYDHNFTKKEAVLTGKRMVDNLIEAGEVNLNQTTAHLVRLSEVINTAISEIKEHIEDGKSFGIEVKTVEGGSTPNYAEDEVWAHYKELIKSREELLKLAQKQDIIDGYGNDVPKVSVNYRKSYKTIKF